ncbi:hypothetical protein HF289_13265 [Acidithiobacillus ferrooxidans]|uniref:hypothetical protein n=1 Tax=Acidithiobacillus ferrooxidans TaxID=920 RepID=UPI001C06A943|nr:hypothetical protein [Acidithiobacillus ferrooxidans]MBU2857799.1 hypothetical protein [Acidithiobacillus ferrooxidans]
MNEFDDLQKFAGGKSVLGGIAPGAIKFFVVIPAGLLLLYPPLFGLDGWGITGGIAGCFMALTAICAYEEIHFLIKGA